MNHNPSYLLPFNKEQWSGISRGQELYAQRDDSKPENNLPGKFFLILSTPESFNRNTHLSMPVILVFCTLLNANIPKTSSQLRYGTLGNRGNVCK